MGTSKRKNDTTGLESQPSGISRRNFVKGAATAAAVAAALPLQPLLGGKETAAEASVLGLDGPDRSTDSFNYRTAVAKAEHIPIVVPPDNGDAARFTYHRSSWSAAMV